MPTLVENQTPEQPERQLRRLARLAVITAGAAFGELLALVVLAIIWPSINALAYAAIVVTGPITGGALTAICLVIRGRNADPGSAHDRHAGHRQGAQADQPP